MTIEDYQVYPKTIRIDEVSGLLTNRIWRNLSAVIRLPFE